MDSESALSPDVVPSSSQPGALPVAPAWHTVVLILGIVALSVEGALQLSGQQHDINRLQTYSFTAATELCMLGWVYFGLRLQHLRLRSLLGSVSTRISDIAADIGFALVFWIASLLILASLGLFWMMADAWIHHRRLIPAGNQLTPDPSQQHTLHTLSQLAPSNAVEVAGWIVLCIIAGIAEEIVFRGYLQRQFTAWTRGATVAGFILSSLLFGAAHGYQGARNMFLLAVFGLLFSILAWLRRSLRAGIIAHSWHDLLAGLALALLKAHHYF